MRVWESPDGDEVAIEFRSRGGVAVVRDLVGGGFQLTESLFPPEYWAELRPSWMSEED